MPELPEVETIRRTLAPALGQRVGEVWSDGLPLRLGRPVELARLRRAARGARIGGLRRRGKYLLIDLERGAAAHTLIVHLGMSGRLRFTAARDRVEPHTHVILSTSGSRGARQLRFVDPRRFGLVEVVRRDREDEHPALARLGVDPLVEGVSGELLHQAVRARRGSLKSILLDQTVVAGVGNIYASEALWRAGVPPTLPGRRLGRARAERLAEAIAETLTRAIEDHGTSLRDFVDGEGRRGEHSGALWVYGREGLACPSCRTAVRRRVQDQRATDYCPVCQRR
jgi:formamidopyrimidine-DNA glycosylase